MATVSIILVNYNTTDDTIECISSLLNNNFQDFNIIVIDNNSDHANQKKLSDWIEGKYASVLNTPQNLKHHICETSAHGLPFYPLKKFISIADIDSSELLKSQLTVIYNPENKGLAAANNIGMKLAQQLKSKFYWLLNNDVVIDKEALSSLINYFEPTINHNIGVVGSKVLFYDEPEIIQSIGGLFNPYTTKQIHIGYNEKDKGQYDNHEIAVSYPYGASLFIKAEYFEIIGAFNEDYFLYFEELDWIEKGKRSGFESGFCYKSKIYHKQGKSTGKKLFNPRNKFVACLFCRNLLIFYSRYYPLLLPIAWFRLLLNFIKAMLKRNYGEALVTLRVMFGYKNCLYYQPK